MNSLITLFIICMIYYTLHRYFPDRFEEIYHKYLIGFVIIYLVAVYLLTYETHFMYKIFRNIHDTTTQPLYSFNAASSNAEFFNQQNPNYNIKNDLLQQQGNRCPSCNNFFVQGDDSNLLKYKIPLQNGGQNDVSNLMLVCPTCFTFH